MISHFPSRFLLLLNVTSNWDCNFLLLFEISWIIVHIFKRFSIISRILFEKFISKISNLSLKIEKEFPNCHLKIIQNWSVEFINGSLKLNFLLWNLKLAPAKRKRETLQKNRIIEQLFLWTSSSSNRSVRAGAILKLQLLSVIEIRSLFTAWQCAKIHASTIGYFRRAFASPNMGILFSEREEITIGIRKV